MTDEREYDPADFAPGSQGCHEALHTTYMLADILSKHLSEHPAILSHPEWKARVDRAAEELEALYQEIGAAHLDANDLP
jgi:hypothetical protein